ncbi:tRNA (adenine-N(1)-)-methyltransferase catalytic subunit trm61 [Mortierella sp. AD031]|nr:tRNA (adenine-N(1)-)-methyltransferase catalytic subunit trm61 [Mortierella sp. AD031]
MSLTKHNFVTYKENNIIENGDLVVLYLAKNLILIRIQEDQEFCCKFGNYRHADMIGLQYGTKLGSNTGRGFVFLLYPTPELWTLILPHRTQILYIADISLVMSYLDLKPGMSMIESGTGSGSFSHSIARTIAPHGHLYTFEYHQDRVAAATKEFEDHGLSHLITIECRDVCKNGFGLENKVDAGKCPSRCNTMFLDLPAPWEAVASAKKAFKQNKVGKICTFSPCIEQISKTVTALTEQGFVDIQMYECLIRFNEVRILQINTLDEALEMERASEKKRKRALPRVLRETYLNSLKEGKQEQGQEQEQEQEESALKKTRVDDGNLAQQESNTPTTTKASSHADVFIPDTAEPRESIGPKNVTVTRLPVEQRGHTSYLLFATFTPASQQPSLAEINASKQQ